MGERKVINKYYPPDFDPLKLKKPKMPPDKQIKTRMMLPFTCKCNICGTYLHIGTKFNMRKETVTDESYLGIEILRFFFKCTRCTTEITMKTDPKSHDYVCESNASRQYDERRDLEAAESALQEMKVQENEDPMRFLEARTYESRREMDIMDALGDILSINKIQGKVDYENVISEVRRKRKEEEEKKAMVEKYMMTSDEVKSQLVKRIDEDEADREMFRKHKKMVDEVKGLQKGDKEKKNTVFTRLKPKFIVKKQVLS
ncbi:unnamed protein product [Blepharisma stoltei]|uniref:Splicing factor YJU2 n=1 Tax=Blepharisma stoltei TaxID=1481888 RepID=A0AAU9K0L3_9CILI|nr:unnamed protein product [Blepharisma stoltei]